MPSGAFGANGAANDIEPVVAAAAVAAAIFAIEGNEEDDRCFEKLLLLLLLLFGCEELFSLMTSAVDVVGVLADDGLCGLGGGSNVADAAFGDDGVLVCLRW